MTRLMDAPSILVDQAPIALMQLDINRAITGMNSGAEAIFNLSRYSARGRSLSACLYHDCALFDLLDHIDQTQTPVSAPSVLLNGPRIRRVNPQQISVSLLREGGYALALMPSDMGNSKQLQEVHGLAGFARILGHEVKNPLAGISGAAQLLMREARPDQSELLNLILEETARITRLTDKLSAFELFSAPRLTGCNIHEVLDRVIRSEEVAFTSEIKFHRSYDPSLPDIQADADHLHVAFQNIIRNAGEAILRSKKGDQIDIHTRFSLNSPTKLSADGKALRTLKIVIKDNGPGIPKADRQRIFDMFYTHKQGGNGLGLTLATQVIAAHQGIIELDSSSDGTQFTLSLPMQSHL